MDQHHFTNSNPSHAERLALGWEVLEGLATGDALGESYSYGHQGVRDRLVVPLDSIGLRRYTDDTEMASAVLEVLVRLRGIDEDVLAWQFRRRFKRDAERGYGKMTRRWLEQTLAGEDWRQVTARAFGGGSFGNGSAMRVAPVGAYFFDDLDKTVTMATASANVTHAHPEGIAGAVAVAVATAVAVRGRGEGINVVTAELWKQVCLKVSEGRTAGGLSVRGHFRQEPLFKKRPKYSEMGQTLPAWIPFHFACGMLAGVWTITQKPSFPRLRLGVTATRMPQSLGRLLLGLVGARRCLKVG
jgi:hypothetical protein